MNKQNYWLNFYKEKLIQEPSSFSKFCLPFIPQESNIIEFGYGTGRDTYFFAKQGFNILGVDYANKLEDKLNAQFIKSDISKYINQTDNTFNVVYSRFFLHSITNKEITKLIKWSKGLFLAEFRAKEDVPILYPNHYRNHINETDFLNKLFKNNFELLYYSKSRDVAQFKNENPLIIRVVAKKEEK